MITKEQAVEMGSKWGNTTLYHATLRNSDGSALRARVNGKCKVWVRRPVDFSLPMKHGLRECFYLTQDNASEWLTEDPTEAQRQAEFRAKQITTMAKRANISPETPLPVLHDALIDAGEDGLAQIVGAWMNIDARN